MIVTEFISSHKLYYGELYGDFKMDFIFVCKNEPTEELIKEFHRGIAKDLIENYGVDTMREVLQQRKLMILMDEEAK